MLYGFNASASKNLLVKDAIDIGIAIPSVVAFVITNLNSLVPMPTTTITTKLFRLVNFVYISELIHFGGCIPFTDSYEYHFGRVLG